ncbi:retroviral-like aspartic protease family protein [Blastomonas sp.]|uniref:retroviral-like aspartic protease family protein n=1 Tax=Blastomonas sp. TaxID=1909299 RepID=UPI0035937350
MKIRLLASALLLIAACAAPGSMAQEITAADTPGADAEVIDLMQDRASRMTVPVSIDGKGPFSFLIDTGSERTVVSRGIAGTLALEFAAMARLVSIAGSKIVETVYVPELTLGRQNYGEVVAPMLERHHIGADGILGLDGLQDQRILFDFAANQIIVEDITQRVSTSGFEIVVTARRRSGQLIFTDATIDGKRINVVIDTGAQSNIGNLALQRRLRSSTTPGLQQASLTSVTGQTLLADNGLVRDFRIGRAHFEYIPIAFADTDAFRELGLGDTPSLLLGMGTLRLFDRMMIDFKQRRVLFDLPRKAPQQERRIRL